MTEGPHSMKLPQSWDTGSDQSGEAAIRMPDLDLSFIIEPFANQCTKNRKQIKHNPTTLGAPERAWFLLSQVPSYRPGAKNQLFGGGGGEGSGLGFGFRLVRHVTFFRREAGFLACKWACGGSFWWSL